MVSIDRDSPSYILVAPRALRSPVSSKLLGQCFRKTMSLTRYLLAHNHDISDAIAPPIARPDFTALFHLALSTHPLESGQIAIIDHPHWRSELQAAPSPAIVGEFLAQALKTYRTHQLGQPIAYSILILGGLKTTPATSSDPSALQPGEWGVDIVETPNSEDFLAKINWSGIISLRDPQEVIQVIL
jgi:hypothetical protein